LDNIYAVSRFNFIIHIMLYQDSINIVSMSIIWQFQSQYVLIKC